MPLASDQNRSPIDRPVESLCVLWARFGPYHLARLRALHTLLETRGVRLVGLETSRTDETYAWRIEERSTDFRREVALTQGTAETTRPSAIRSAIRAALDRVDPDAVAIPSYSTPDAHAALAWCRQHRRVAVMLFDSRAEDAERLGWRETIKRALVSEYDAALVAGTPQAAYLGSLGMPRSHIFTPLDVVDNAYFQDGADQARSDATPPHPSPYLLSINRFTERKNVEVLIRAYALYRTHTPDPWPLVLLGDGPERRQLEAAAAETQGVTFGGFQQVDALPRWYGFAGAYIHPASSDPWGLVVNEAMASGLPVIVSTGAGCAPDLVVNGENGLTFDPGDANELAAHLATLASSTSRRSRMGQRSSEIISRFRPQDFAEGLWGAIQAGRSRANRRMALPARGILSALAVAARHPRAFHSVEA